MKTIPWDNLDVHGEQRRRALLNFDRLETEPYEPDTVFKPAAYEWPGDWEGRTLLALVLLAQATQREPRHLSAIMQRLPDYLNAQGFFGACHEAGVIDEQQLSGNSWFLRAMVEHYKWRQDPFSLSVIERMIEHLLLPARGHYAEYPVLPEQRVFAGGAIGGLQQEQIGAWRLSTDIGCAFIMLDGATQAYQIVPRRELKDLIDEMIAKFKTIDLAGLSFQTHATLSALRGVLRHYETTGDASLLRKAEEVFALYLQKGMTATFANYNWFGRSEWTESCAVVDSFIVAVSLWQHTGKAVYLDAAHHIYYNGIGYGQRPNGGFGCDVCTGAHGERMIAPKSPELFEAFWCCTMRGGEGLARAVEYCYFVEDSGHLFVPFYADGLVRIGMSGGHVVIGQRTGYPYEGDVHLEVLESAAADPVTVGLYVPSWAEKSSIRLRFEGQERSADMQNGFVTLTELLKKGSVIELSFDISLRKEYEPDSSQGAFSYRHGAMVLGIEGGESPVELDRDEELAALGSGRYRMTSSCKELAPINDLIEKSHEAAVKNRKQVLFYEQSQLQFMSE
ncbi:beta-L-arabinofuranosidase domain-containing protein [Paenibacillus sp. GCM10027626]|uniref:beta-L-arabinofuranosidase domain-containing protein n=1 Tax=Paenibacillus sp. GCM10027626 TaxID=3273411 RepID=UPI00362D13E5